MNENTIKIIRDVFRNEANDTLTDGITIIIDGQIKKMLDIIIAKEELLDYSEATKEVFLKGIQYYVEKYK